MMGVSIHLLGTPRVEHDGHAVPAPRGRKVWALLAYLLLTERPQTRSHLAGLLFSEADDPLRALRWNLNAVRHLLADAAVVDSEPLAVRLHPGTFVDVAVLLHGTWLEAVAIPAMEDELLAGMDFSTAATFETWLANQRRHLRAAAAAALAEGALARLGTGDAENAVDLANRLVRLEPLDDNHQTLLLRALTAAGDHAGAERHMAACRELFRSELGVDPGDLLEDARSGPAFSAPAARGLAAIRAQMDAGQAAMRAGANDVGLEYLRQAAAESHVVGDDTLQTQALLVLGSEMVHASRGRQLEGAAALHRVVALAEDKGDEELAATAHQHLAWVDLMAARFGPMHRKLEQAAGLRVVDPAVRSWGHLTAGMGYLATAHYAQAEQSLCEMIAGARATGDVRLAGFGLCVLAGVFGHRGEFAQAKATAAEAADLAKSTGNLALMAFTDSKLAEVEISSGSVAVGHQLAEHAMALSDQIHETCVQAMAGTQLGLLCFEQGDLDGAIGHLGAAWSRPMILPDHVWKGALALDALCTVAVGERLPQARTWVTDLESLASRTGMRELLVRAYLHRHDLGDDTGEAATMLAAQIDNPLLHEMVGQATGVAVPA